MARKKKIIFNAEKKSYDELATRVRWGESYTSLLLGLAVVILAALLGISLIRGRSHPEKKTLSVSEITSQLNSGTQNTNTNQNQGDQQQVQQAPTTDSSYTVAEGDTLWSIAEKEYNSGYNWVDIAQANNLSDPNVISAGTKLIIPKAQPKIVTVAQNTLANAPNAGDKITGNSYTIQKGDDLWNIAIRAYGDGYKWVDIAKANNLTDPGLIFSGNTLTIPR